MPGKQKDCPCCKRFNDFQKGLCNPDGKCTFKPADRKQIVFRYKELIKVMNKVVNNMQAEHKKNDSLIKYYKVEVDDAKSENRNS